MSGITSRLTEAIGLSNIDKDLSTMSLSEVTDIATQQAAKLAETAENFQDLNSDAKLAGDAAMANRVKPQKPAKKEEVRKVSPNEQVDRKETPEVDKELDQHAQRFVDQYQTMKKASITSLKKEITDMGKDATPEKITKAIMASYGRGHEAEASHAFEFLLQTTTGEVNDAVQTAKSDYENANKKQIDKGLNIENIAKDVSENQFKGEEGKIQNLNEKFVDLVAMEADTSSLNEQLLNKISPEEVNKVLAHFTHIAGDKMRTSEVGPEMHAIWQSLQAIQGYRGVQNQIKKADPAQHYERNIAHHITHLPTSDPLRTSAPAA